MVGLSAAKHTRLCFDAATCMYARAVEEAAEIHRSPHTSLGLMKPAGGFSSSILVAKAEANMPSSP
ncbi:hypothetical protein OAH50_00055 [bacterium]|nr:hypothetical protein [bacterium]